MALEILTEKDNISSDCGTILYKDNTGAYDVTTNPTGYGAPNATRASLYLKFFLTLKTTSGDEQITVPAYNANSVTQWSIPLTQDGYYEAYVFGTLVYAGGTTYALGSVIYHVGTNEFYKSLTAGNLGNAVTDVAFWAPVTEVDELKAAIAATQPNAYADVYEHIELCNSRVCKTKAYLKEENCECTPGASKYNKIRNLIDGADINGSIAAYARAQAIVEEIQGQCNCIDQD